MKTNRIPGFFCFLLVMLLISMKMADAAELRTFSAKKFLSDLNDASAETPLSDEKFRTLREKAVEALAVPIYIHDDVLLRLVDLGRRLDYRDAGETAKRMGKTASATMDYARTFAMIDELIPLLEGREWLISRLLGSKAHGLFVMGRLEESYAVREQQFRISKKMEVEIGLQTLEDQVDFADVAAKTQEADVADKLYSYATAFPFYSLTDYPEKSIQARELVIRAASGLIGVRRNNAKKLRQIFLAPAITAAVKGELDNAYKEAGLPVEE